MKLKYTLKDLNNGEIVDKFGMQEGGSAELFLANNCFRRMKKYTPQDTQAMATTVTIKPGKIIYEQEYAVYQYDGYTRHGKVKHYTTPRTGPHWDKKMMNAEGDIVVRELENYVKWKG